MGLSTAQVLGPNSSLSSAHILHTTAVLPTRLNQRFRKGVSHGCLDRWDKDVTVTSQICNWPGCRRHRKVDHTTPACYFFQNVLVERCQQLFGAP